MNLKKAKALRRQAKLETIGRMEVDYEPIGFKIGKDGYRVKKPRLLASSCTRYRYHKLKVMA